jgi:hypothetical protein
MNIFLKSLSYPPSAKMKDFQTNFIDWNTNFISVVHHHPQILAILLSAACIGNDGRSCPLFHGSLGPLLLAKTDNDAKLQQILAQSHNVTWTQAIHGTFRDLRNVLSLLEKTRYSAKSLKTLEFYVKTETQLAQILSFVKRHCQKLETLVLRAEKARLDSTSFFSTLAAGCAETLTRLKIFHINLPDLSEIYQLEHLEEFELDSSDLGGVTTQQFNKKVPKLKTLVLVELSGFDDDTFAAFLKTMPNLRHLELIKVRGVTGSFLEKTKLPYLESFKLNADTEIQVCGLPHCAETLRELNLSICRIAGIEKWKSFPVLKRVRLLDVTFSAHESENVNFTFNTLNEFIIRTCDVSNPLFAKFLGACRMKSIEFFHVDNCYNFSTEFFEGFPRIPIKNFRHTHIHEPFFERIPLKPETPFIQTVKSIDTKEQLISVEVLKHCPHLEHLAYDATSEGFPDDQVLPTVTSLECCMHFSKNSEKIKLPKNFRVNFPFAERAKFLLNLNVLDEMSDVDSDTVPNIPCLEVQLKSPFDVSDRKHLIAISCKLKQHKSMVTIYFPETCQYELPAPTRNRSRTDPEVCEE